MKSRQVYILLIIIFISAFLGLYIYIKQSKSIILRLDNIFALNHSWVDNLPKDDLVTIVSLGDISFARKINNESLKLNNYV